jgi:predicted nucleic acid-binding protein
LVVYLDSSVVLAGLLNEPRQPDSAFWQQPMVSSRLLEYEVWARLHAYGRAAGAAPTVLALLSKVGLAELRPHILARALTPFPLPVRTLDALHLATLDHLRSTGSDLALATYDRRMADAAVAIGFALHDDVRPPR